MASFKLGRLSIAVAFALGFGGAAQAQVVINDTLTGATSSYNWTALNGACLTAGDGSLTSAGNASSIPACAPGGKVMSYYSGQTLVGGATGKLPDAIGSGALRLTNGAVDTGSGGTNQTGAVVSNFTFPTTQGIQVTWTSVTYGGNAYKNSAGALSGADGISFFLSDGAQPATVGALGGSLGYSCSNVNGTYDGVVGGYIGIGMDEYGNFSNKSDNTNTGPAQAPGAIALRGAGHTAWAWLSTNYPTYYPSTLSSSAQKTAVQTTCKTGLLYNFSGSDITVSVPVPTTYTANYSRVKSSCTSSCTVTTGTITSSSPIPSSSTCDSSGNPVSSSTHTCTYTNIASSSIGSQTVSTGSQIPSNIVGGAYQLDYDYPYLSGSTFPTGTSIYNQEAAGTTGGASNAVRGSAIPITYSLTITADGLLDLSYAINSGPTQSVVSKMKITQSNGPLPTSFRFGFSAGTGGGSNVHEITCFKAAPANVSGSTAGSNVESGRVQSTNQVYLAFYHPVNSWGSVTAQNLVFTAAAPASGSTAATASTLVVSPTVNWDAGCVLTGGLCLSMANTANPNGLPVTQALAYTARDILTWDGAKGIPFEWANLTSTQQTALTAGDTSSTADRLNFLRGYQGKEVAAGGTFRNRNSLLGDITDSSPVWVGPPSSPYGSTWVDLLNTTATPPEGGSYAAFANGTAATRLNVVYVGSNDGMLHGFRAGSYNAGTFVGTYNDGQEVLSYVPNLVASMIHSTTPAVDFSSPSYSHNFYVDGMPGQGDLYYNGNWHTWVATGLGPGGQAAGAINDNTAAVGSVFALDVTDPTQFQESSAKTLVMGDWSSASLNAGTCAGAASNCGDHMGETYGTPLIRRLHDGNWAVLFGNGLNSKTGTAGLFIVHVNSSTGNTSFQYIDTGKGSTGARDGLTQLTAVDLDGDHITDYVYAGDVQGNVFRFDLTNSDSTKWSVGAPIFTTQANQPITSGIAVSAETTIDKSGSASALPRVILAFGTGQKLPQTISSNPIYSTTPQSIYGIWDADMTTWNAKSSTQFASIATGSIPPITPGASGNLFQHSITTSGSQESTDITATVCWDNSTACGATASNLQMGWELDLGFTPATTSPVAPALAEQVLFNPTLVGDIFNTNTSIPKLAQPLTCDTSTDTGVSIGVSMATGGATTVPYFGTPGVIGVSTQATGSSSAVVATDGTTWLVFQKNDGTGGTLGVHPPPVTTTAGTPGQRLTWTKMR